MFLNSQLIRRYSTKSSSGSLRKVFFADCRLRNPTISSINAAILAINPDSIFKVDSYAHTAVAISITACGLGIACDFWFLLRYSWVDLRIFVVRTFPTPSLNLLITSDTYYGS